MPTTTASLPLPVAPPDVLAFAEKQGVSAYLPPLLALSRRVFPTWLIEVFLEEDAEIAGEWFIVFEVQVPEDATSETIFALDQQWREESLPLYPPTHLCNICLGMA